MGTGTQNLGKWVRWYSVFYSKYYNSGGSFISFISDACSWSRRHQIIFLVGSFLTTRQLFQVIVYAFLFAAVLGMGKVLYVYFSQGGKKDRFTKIHFSIEILLAVVYVTGRCVVAKN